MADESSETTRRVRSQYEDLPYPPRDPEEERSRLLVTDLDHLSLINHYCYRGRRDFRQGFRVLVAGGGTGDALIYLAEQLKDTDARITYVDLSEQSMGIARRRAEIRGLAGIEWIRGSLLDLPEMAPEPFDYINCGGVLHHLADPEAGLRALADVMKDDGAMCLMVYAPYGRTGVYQMQELMRIVNRGLDDPGRRLANARAILSALPETNWFKRGEHLIRDHVTMGDAGIYDMFLHSTDRAYSIPQLHEFLASAGLRLVTFRRRERAILTPGVAYKVKPLTDMLADMPPPCRQGALELFSGAIIKHTFFAARPSDTVARPDDAENVPAFHLIPDFGAMLARELAGKPGRSSITANLPKGMQVTIPVGPYTAGFARHIDGIRTIREIAERIRGEDPSDPDAAEVAAAFPAFFEPLNLWDLLLLRHRLAHPPTPIDQIA